MAFEPVAPPYNHSDPSANFLSSSALDFLLIELVPLAYRVTNTTAPDSSSATAAGASQAAQSLAPTDRSSVASPPSVTDNASVMGASPGTSRNAPTAPTTVGTTTVGAGQDDEETQDAVHHRLEAAGYRVGQGLVERFSRDRPRFNDNLDVIKFICKDLWSLVFGKNIDNLKTNHRGVFVLTDNVFRPFSRMSTEAGGQAVVRAQPFLWFPCGIVRGALAALGIEATVQAEINDLPGAIFQIKTNPTK